MRNEKRSLELAANDHKPKHYLTCPGCGIRQGKMMNHYHSSYLCQQAIDSTYGMPLELQLELVINDNNTAVSQFNNNNNQIVNDLENQDYLSDEDKQNRES